MAKIPVRPPNTPREVKAAKSAIHQLEKRSAKIRRDIMNRRVDNLSEARRIAASQSAKAKELRIDLQNSPAVKYSKRNKYMRYRMPTRSSLLVDNEGERCHYVEAFKHLLQQRITDFNNQSLQNHSM